MIFMTDNFILDVTVGICSLLILYTLVWYVYRITEKNQNPIFHNDNINIEDLIQSVDQEVIYQPSKDYMDKLEYSLFDLKKSSPIPRHLDAYASTESDPSVAAKDLKKEKKI